MPSTRLTFATEIPSIKASLTVERSFKNLATILVGFAAVLHDKARALEALRYRQSNMFLPIMKLPPEIMSEIFLYACFDPSAPLSVAKLPQKFHKLRHNITSTCYHWRSIVLTTSALWNHILVKCDDTIGPNLPFLKLELARSANRSLRLTFQLESISQHWYPALSTIQEALPRAESIQIHDSYRDGLLQDLMGSPLPIHFSRLRSFIIRGGHQAHLCNIDLSDAPILEDLVLPSGVAIIGLQSPRITRISTFIESAEMSNNCLVPPSSHLKVLNVVITSAHSSLPTQLFGSHLPALEHLHYSNRGHNREDYYISSLAAPNLSHLEIVPWTFPPFTSQFASLKSLKLLRPIAISMLSDGLEGIPTLRELFLVLHRPGRWLGSIPVCVLDDVLEMLSSRPLPDQFQFVPRLRLLGVGLRHIWNPGEDTAEKMLTIRNRGIAEREDMPFVLSLDTRDTDRADLKRAADFLRRHPHSVHLQTDDIATNPFFIENW